MFPTVNLQCIDSRQGTEPKNQTAALTVMSLSFGKETQTWRGKKSEGSRKGRPTSGQGTQDGKQHCESGVHFAKGVGRELQKAILRMWF